jgi:predicted HicB family RNase H-like nuclease
MNTMSYKGYAARVEFDDEDGLFFGRLAGIRDGVSFHADTVADQRAAFHEAVDDYVLTCAKIGKTPERPYSGRIMVRVDPNVHQQAALAAELAGKSLNQWTEDALRDAAARTAKVGEAA